MNFSLLHDARQERKIQIELVFINRNQGAYDLASLSKKTIAFSRFVADTGFFHRSL